MSISLEQLQSAIYGQESNSGRADTSRENYAGARGPMQVTRSTFDGMKQRGLIPADYDHANPEHTKDAGLRWVEHLYNKYGGDAPKVAAAYYSGEKAVRPDGSIADYRDRKNKAAPSTLEYVAQVLKRAGAVDSAFGNVDAARAVLAGGSAGYDWNNKMPGITDRPVRRYGTTDDSAIMRYQPIDMGADRRIDPFEIAQKEAARLEAVQAEANSSTLLDKARAAFHDDLFGTVMRSVVRPSYTPVPGFTPDYGDVIKRLGAMDEGELQLIGESNSPEHQARLEWEIEYLREQRRKQYIGGVGSGMVAGLLAGLPSGYATGFGAAKALQLARVGSLVLAYEGRTAAALGSAVAENVGGNVATQFVQGRLDPRYNSPADYVMAAAFGLAPVPLAIPSIRSAGKMGAKVRETVDAMQRAAAEEHARLQRVAEGNTDGSHEAVQAEINRVAGEELRTATEPTTSAPRISSSVDEELTKLAAPTVEADVAPRLNTAVDFSKLDDMEAIQNAGPGVVHDTNLPEHFSETVDIVRQLAEQFLPNETVGFRLMRSNEMQPGRRGVMMTRAGTRSYIIAIADQGGHNKMHNTTTAIHELGHILEYAYMRNTPTALREGINTAFSRFNNDIAAGKFDDAAGQRFRLDELGRTTDRAAKIKAGLESQRGYLLKQPEYLAEQFAKYVQEDIVRNGKNLNLTGDLVDRMKSWFKALIAMFTKAQQKSWLAPETELADWFNAIRERKIEAAPADIQHRSTEYDIDTDAVAVQHGLDLLPRSTTLEQAEANAILSIYRKAASYGKPLQERISKLMQTSMFEGAQSTANVLAQSENPVARMVAAELLENPSGAQGRRRTAALDKYLTERRLLGNTLNEVQSFYNEYRSVSGATVIDDVLNGKEWQRFNTMVAEEIESRRSGSSNASAPESVRKAADSLEAAYERLRVEQVRNKTTGWGALPESSVGYMPHSLSKEAVVSLNTEQMRVLHSTLVDQFVGNLGYDATFAANLASKYIDRVRRRALGGFDAPINLHNTGAASIVQDALEAMNLSKEQVRAMMEKYLRGAAKHTKKRLDLDLLSKHTLEDGSSFRLLDLMETDQFHLLRGQIYRVSGEAALAKYGVMGKNGFSLLRTAMMASSAEKVTAKELEAFDQIAAEFLGEPFGTQSQWTNRVMQVNSLARLGGMAFTQFGELSNAVFHVGVAKTLASIGSFSRLRSEIKALARGERVDNPILSSLEQFSGAEFGTNEYKTVFPFDSGNHGMGIYGKDSASAFDRLLRGATHVQGKLSLWRSLHSVQQRGMAEQIVRKTLEYVKSGADDAALRDMGITKELQGKLQKELQTISEWNGEHLTNVDITKMRDLAAADEFVQAVHRGTSQIIQGTFIGETNKWSTDSTMRVLTQFRTFSLTSVEKQWARQVGNVGIAGALGMMLGSVSLVAPVVAARVYLNSVNRPDQEKYLDENLTTEKIARASINYIAMSGLAGDFLDMTSAITGYGVPTGGRGAAAGTGFVGNVVAPSAGLLDDAYRAVQNTKEGTDPYELMKVLPFNRLPFLVPAVNSLKE